MASRAMEAQEQPFPVSYIVVGLMSVLAAWLVSVMVGTLVSTWRGGAFWLGAVAAIVFAVSLREAIAREHPNAETAAALRMRELLIIAGLSFPAALILRYLPWDPLGMVDMALNIWFDPGTYVDGRDLLTIVLLVGAWAFPIRPLDILERLVVTQRDLPKPRASVAYDDLTSVRFGLPDLTKLHRQLSGWTLTSTTLLAVALAVFWRSFGTFTHMLSGAATIAYAALGFTLIAMGNFELRRSRWLIEGVEVEGQSADRWAAAGGAITAVLALIAIAIPAVILLAGTRAVITGVLLAFMGLTRLFRLPSATGFNGVPPQIVTPQLPFLPPPPQPHVNQSGSMPEWLVAVVVAFAFLVVALLVLWLAAWWRRGPRGPRLQLVRAISGILAFLRHLGWSLRRWLAGLRAAVADLAERLARAPRAAATRARYRSGPPAGSAADLVRYWYGQVVRQGGRTGLPRRPGQTAEEYRAAIHDQVIEAAPSLDALTSAYVEARYSGRDLPAARGTLARDQFRRVRQAMSGWLRRLRRGEKPKEG